MSSLPPELLVLRHAKSSHASGAASDFERPLAPRGRRDAARVGRWLAARGLRPDRAVASPSLRTRQTLERLQPYFRAPPETDFEPGLYLATAEAILRRVKQVPPGDPLMVIGHNPGIGELAALLAGAGEPAALDRLHQKFPTGALAVLRVATKDWRELRPGAARLDALVFPRELD